jgi:hypothetical protein
MRLVELTSIEIACLSGAQRTLREDALRQEHAPKWEVPLFLHAWQYDGSSVRSLTERH